MKPDEFEKRLQSQPLRQIPSDWRERILRGARPIGHSSRVTRHSFLSTLFWPNPKAWAGLAAIWIVIAAIQFASRDQTKNLAKDAAPNTPERMVLLKQQNQLLAELFAQMPPKDADRPKHNLNQPRSEWRMNALLT